MPWHSAPLTVFGFYPLIAQALLMPAAAVLTFVVISRVMQQQSQDDSRLANDES